MSEPRKVIIIGGGFGGLLVACEIARRGGQPLLLEAGPEAGGVASTVRDQGYLLEPAAGSFLLPNAHLSPILGAAGATVEAASAAARCRYVFERQKRFELNGPRSLATGLVSLKGKARMLREPWTRAVTGGDDESIESFMQRRLGPEVGRLAATLMAHGVFAGSPEQLSARAAFPGFVELEESSGSLVRGGLAKRRNRPKGAPRASVHVASKGMAGLANQLSSYLGDGFRHDWKVDSIEPDGDGWLVNGPEVERATNLIVALAPSAAKRLVPDPLAVVLSDAKVSPVAVVGLGGRDVDVPALPGFGALVGPETDLRVLGLLFESSYAPNRAPERHHLLKAIYGGAADPSVLALGDRELIELAIEEASKVIGRAIQPSWTRVVRQSPGIPQYTKDHMAWLERITSVSELFPGLHLAGWGYRGIGLTALAKDATRLATLTE